MTWKDACTIYVNQNAVAEPGHFLWMYICFLLANTTDLGSNFSSRIDYLTEYPSASSINICLARCLVMFGREIYIHLKQPSCQEILTRHWDVPYVPLMVGARCSNAKTCICKAKPKFPTDVMFRIPLFFPYDNSSKGILVLKFSKKIGIRWWTL